MKQWILGLGALAVLLFSLNSLERFINIESRIESFFYLPESSYLKLMALGHEELLADIYLMQTTVYYGKHYFEHRDGKYKYEWLYHLFDIITDLDKWYYHVYMMAGHLNDDPHKKVYFFKKGAQQFPEDWKMTEMVGFTYFYDLNDKAAAAPYYVKASRLGKPPMYIASLAGKFYRQAGYYESAIQILLEAAGNAESDDVRDEFLIRAETLKKILELQVLAEIFKSRQGRIPVDEYELLLYGYLNEVPQHWWRYHLNFDWESGRILTQDSKK